MGGQTDNFSASDYYVTLPSDGMFNQLSPIGENTFTLNSQNGTISSKIQRHFIQIPAKHPVLSISTNSQLIQGVLHT